MPSIDVYNQNREKVGSCDLNDSIFDVDVSQAAELLRRDGIGARFVFNHERRNMGVAAARPRCDGAR